MGVKASFSEILGKSLNSSGFQLHLSDEGWD